MFTTRAALSRNTRSRATRPTTSHCTRDQHLKLTRIRRAIVTLAVLAAVGMRLGPLSSAAESQSSAKTYNVTIENMQFTPADLTVHAGDRIVWTNKDFFPHSATANDKKFDSGGIASGASWTYEAKTNGDYPYGCTFHPPMKAQIAVRCPGLAGTRLRASFSQASF